MNSLLKKIKACKICKAHLPYAPKPILNFNSNAKIMIVGQAPGTKVHESGLPWNDKSGDRLRDWLGVTNEEFYNPNFFAIVPMGFCYPGKGKTGDLPPRTECAEAWMQKILKELKNIEVIITIGIYSQKYFLDTQGSVTENVIQWKKFAPKFFPLPHPSPRNNIWLKKNMWFEKKILPELKKKINAIMN